MEEKQKILFLINPISGSGHNEKILSLIPDLITSRFSPEIKFTEYAGHAVELAKEACEEGFDAVIAVGGDGSVNEVGQSLVGKQTALGIIPAGSGNGYARHHKIPLKIRKALEFLNRSSVKSVDIGELNGKRFLGVAGVGFDSYIAHLFDKDAERGFFTYIRLSVIKYFNYKEKEYTLVIDGVEHKEKALIICVANSNQYGNNAQISPNSILDDGKFNVIIIRKVPFWRLLFFLRRFFNGSILESKYCKEIVGEHVLIKQDNEWAHIDGEPVRLGKVLEFKVLPKSLKVLC